MCVHYFVVATIVYFITFFIKALKIMALTINYSLHYCLPNHHL